MAAGPYKGGTKRGGGSMKSAAKRKRKSGPEGSRKSSRRSFPRKGKNRESLPGGQRKGGVQREDRSEDSVAGLEARPDQEGEAPVAAPKAEPTAEGRKAIMAARQSKKSTMLRSAEYKALREQSAAISTASAAEQAEWVWRHHAMASGASSLERGSFSGECVATLQSSSPGLLHELKHQIASTSSSSGPCGAPVVLVLAASAVSANNIVKKLRDPAFGCVAKLFAKHIKVEEQQKLLNSSPVLLGVGTPNRVLKLCELEALSLDRLRLLVLDVQRDAKLMTPLDIQEVRADFSKLFGEHCLPRFAGRGGLLLGLVDGSKL